MQALWLHWWPLLGAATLAEQEKLLLLTLLLELLALLLLPLPLPLLHLLPPKLLLLLLPLGLPLGRDAVLPPLVIHRPTGGPPRVKPALGNTRHTTGPTYHALQVLLGLPAICTILLIVVFVLICTPTHLRAVPSFLNPPAGQLVATPSREEFVRSWCSPGSTPLPTCDYYCAGLSTGTCLASGGRCCSFGHPPLVLY